MVQADGSSPHTWGIPGERSTRIKGRAVHPHIRGAYPLPANLMTAIARFIPTYVGHTNQCHHSVSQLAVHPHIRGAYTPACCTRQQNGGSSPHTWGIRGPRFHNTGPSRFIPTYVGHTYLCRPDIKKSAVHPHIRGAYNNQNRSDSLADGSSPHTWGIQMKAAVSSMSGRFIPTYVGHTPAAANFSLNLSVHPHIRGAYTGSP